MNDSLKKTEDPKQKQKLLKKCRANKKSIEKLNKKIERAQKKNKYYIGFISPSNNAVWWVNHSFGPSTIRGSCRLNNNISTTFINDIIPNSIVLKNTKNTDDPDLVEASKNFKKINAILMRKTKLLGYIVFSKEINMINTFKSFGDKFVSDGNLFKIDSSGQMEQKMYSCEKILSTSDWDDMRGEYIEDDGTEKEDNDRWCVYSEKVLKNILMMDETYGKDFKKIFRNLDENDPDKCDRIPSIYKELLNQSATKIQALFRDMTMEEAAAELIQAAYRGKKTRDKLQEKEQIKQIIEKLKSPFLKTFPLNEHSIPESTKGKLFVPSSLDGGDGVSSNNFEKFKETLNNLGDLKNPTEEGLNNIKFVYRFMMTYLIKVFEMTLNELNPDKYESFNYTPESINKLIEMVGPILKDSISLEGEWKSGISALNNKIKCTKSVSITTYDYLPIIQKEDKKVVVSHWWENKSEKSVKENRQISNKEFTKNRIIKNNNYDVLELMYYISSSGTATIRHTITDLLIRNNSDTICAPHHYSLHVDNKNNYTGHIEQGTINIIDPNLNGSSSD